MPGLWNLIGTFNNKKGRKGLRDIVDGLYTVISKYQENNQLLFC